WPALSAAGTVGFVASVDHGPAPIGVFTADRSETRKIAGVGDTVVGIGKLASFGLYPTMAISATRAVTVAIARDGGGAGVDGIVLVPPPPSGLHSVHIGRWILEEHVRGRHQTVRGDRAGRHALAPKHAEGQRKDLVPIAVQVERHR